MTSESFVVPQSTFFSGDVTPDGLWMLIGSRNEEECQWRPAIKIDNLAYQHLVSFATLRVGDSLREDREEGRSGNRTMAEKISHDYTGLSGEYAAAKYLNMFWEARFEPGNRDADLGVDIQVRTTTYVDGKLIIRPFPDHYYQRHILCILSGQYVGIAGWAHGADVYEGGPFASSSWDFARKLWEVPLLSLRPMSEFAVPAVTVPRWCY